MKFYIVIALLAASTNAIHLRGDPPAADAKKAAPKEEGTKLPNMGKAQDVSL